MQYLEDQLSDIKQEWENVLQQVQKQTDEYLTSSEKEDFQDRLAILSRELEEKNR